MSARIVGRKIERGDFADPNAVEQHCGAGQQAGHGVIEPHLINRALPESAGVVEPIDEAERRGDDDEYEGADERIGRACFHVSLDCLRA